MRSWVPPPAPQNKGIIVIKVNLIEIESDMAVIRVWEGWGGLISSTEAELDQSISLFFFSPALRINSVPCRTPSKVL